TSERLSLNRNGLTLLFSTLLPSAPASKLIQGASTLSGVRHRMPYAEASSSAAMSEDHRAPLSMSSEETYGLMLCITDGSQSRRITATLWLVEPDQLIKTFIPYAPPNVSFRTDCAL